MKVHGTMANIDSLVQALCSVRFYLLAVAAAASMQWPCTMWAVAGCAVLEAFYQFNRRTQRRRNFPPVSSGDVAVVTGGSRGLGRELVSLLVRRKCQVVVLDVEPLDDAPGPVQYIHCDLASVATAEHTIREVVLDLQRQNKHVSLLVNNAGVRHSGSFLETDQATLSRVFNINTFSPMALVRAVVAHHVARSPARPLSVVNVASILASFGPCNLSAYSASKAACMQFHECMSEELRRHPSIQMLLVLPGQLDTCMFSDVVPSRQFLAPVVDHRRLARKILDRVDAGGTGVLCDPLYANMLPAMKAMPMSIQRLARWFSQMDEKVSSNSQAPDSDSSAE